MYVCLYVGGLPIIQYPTCIGEIIISTMTDADAADERHALEQ